MILINTPISIVFKIAPHDSPPANIDLIIVNPEGVTKYDEGGVIFGGVYTPPTSTVEGTFTFTKEFDITGMWQVKIVWGTCTNLVCIKKQLIHCVHVPNSVQINASLDENCNG